MEIVRLDSAIRARGSDGEGEGSESLALALATSMVPRLRRWAAAKAKMDADIWTLESKLEEWRSPLLAATQGSGEAARLEEERARLEEQLLRLRTELRKIERRPWPHLRALWMLVWGNDWRAEREAARRGLAEREGRLEELSTRLSGQVEALALELEQLREQRQALDPVPRVVEGLRALDYVFLPRRVRRSGDAGPGEGVQVRWLLADPFGEPVTLDAPHVAMSAQELDDLSRGLSGLDMAPVLLSLADSDPAPELRLLGAERQLSEVASGLSKFASTTQARNLSLVVVPPGGALAGFLSRAVGGNADLHGRTVAPELDRESHARLSEVRKAADDLGAVARSNLHAPQSVYASFAAEAERLPGVAERAESARDRSAAVLTDQVRRAGLNAALARYRMFCPECNALPTYLAKAYGLTEDAIERLDTRHLRRALEELRDRRLSTTEGRELGPDERLAVDQRWTDALEELTSLEETYRFHRSEAQAIESGPGSDDPDARLRLELAAREAGMRETRYREIVHDLQSRPLALPEASHPPDASSEDADDDEPGRAGPSTAPARLDPVSRLEYEPGDREAPWSCRRCGTAFDENTALLGAVDRVRTEVVYPVLSALWGHRIVRSGAAKAVEQAAKEIEDRSEEEAALLREPVEGFRSDAARLRTQVEEASAQGNAVSRRLVKVAEHYARFGLLPAKELDQVRSSARGTLARMEEIRQALDRLAAAERGMEDTIGAGRRARAAPTPPDRRFLEEDAARLTPFGELGGADFVGRPADGHFAAPAQPNEAARLVADTRSCAVCGGPAPLRATFCPACGAALPRESATPPVPADHSDARSPAPPTEGHVKPSRTSLGAPKND